MEKDSIEIFDDLNLHHASDDRKVENPSSFHSIMVSDSHAELRDKKNLSLRTLACISVVAAGIQFGWALQLSLLTPYIQTLGIPHEWASFIWLCGPISGLLVQPIVGVLSDNCKSKYGKRKPFILLGALFVIFSIVLISFSAELGYYLGDRNLKKNETKRMACFLFILGFWFLDLSNNAVQGPGRALLADLAEDEQKYTANSFFSFWISFGNILGYSAGSIGEWHKWFPFLEGKNCGDACANLKAAFILAILFLIICTAITLLSAKEENSNKNYAMIELIEKDKNESLISDMNDDMDNANAEMAPNGHQFEIQNSDDVDITKSKSKPNNIQCLNENKNNNDNDSDDDDDKQYLISKNEIKSDKFENEKDKIVVHENEDNLKLEKSQRPSDTISLLGNDNNGKGQEEDNEIVAEKDKIHVINPISIKNKNENKNKYDNAYHLNPNSNENIIKNKKSEENGSEMMKMNENSDKNTKNNNDKDEHFDFGNGLDSIFVNLLIGLRSLSSSMKYILLIMACSWMAWFPFLLYDTDWMGKEIFHGQVQNFSGSENFSNSENLNYLYEKGVRLGAFGLLLNSVIQGIASIFLDFFCKKFGPRRVWAGGNFLIFFCLFATFFVTIWAKMLGSNGKNIYADENLGPKVFAVAIFSILGIPFAITVSIPFSLTAELTTESGGGQGLAMGILNLAVVIPQILISLSAGSWDKLFGGGNEPAFLAGAAFAFISAVLALRFVPDLNGKYISVVSHSSH